MRCSGSLFGLLRLTPNFSSPEILMTLHLKSAKPVLYFLRIYEYIRVFFFGSFSFQLNHRIFPKFIANIQKFLWIFPHPEKILEKVAQIFLFFLLFLLNVFSLLWCDCKIEMTTDHDITHSRYHGKYERIFALLCPRSELIIFKVNNHLRCRTGQKHTIPAISQTFTPCPISAGGKSEEASEANDFLP